LTLVVDGGEWSLSWHGHYTFGQRTHCTHWV